MGDHQAGGTGGGSVGAMGVWVAIGDYGHHEWPWSCGGLWGTMGGPGAMRDLGRTWGGTVGTTWDQGSRGALGALWLTMRPWRTMKGHVGAWMGGMGLWGGLEGLWEVVWGHEGPSGCRDHGNRGSLGGVSWGHGSVGDRWGVWTS